jgi:hypothetical protein
MFGLSKSYKRYGDSAIKFLNKKEENVTYLEDKIEEKKTSQILI